MNFDNMIDKTKAVDIKTVKSNKSWKDRIVEFMTSKDDAASTVHEILEHTDPKYSEDNFQSRKHCLDSQMTYLRQDYNIVTRSIDKKIVLLGIERDGKLIPFKNAVKYV